MIAFTSNRLAVLAAIFGLAIAFSTVQSRAADEMANPQYACWSSFKPGTSVTFGSDTKVGPNAIDAHMDKTTKLLEVTPESLTLEVTMTTKVMDHTSTTPATKITVKAMTRAKDFKETGTAEVAAAGKTYKCKVMEISGDALAANASRPGGRPLPANAKATIYVNHDVPGGVVKIEVASGDGKMMTFTLTALDVK